jgi:hypothetical protein
MPETELKPVPHFVFLHVGADGLLPTLLVRSIRAQHPHARLIQCSDHLTQEIGGVSEVFRSRGNISNLMRFRLVCFARLGLTTPALYLDTDMLVMAPIDPALVLGECEIAVCAREFGRTNLINTSFGGMNLSEYEGKTFGEIYPYLGCATISQNAAFWQECLDEMDRLDPKFHFWYGDQEAIRNIVNAGKYRSTLLPESIYAFLPGEIPRARENPRIF